MPVYIVHGFRWPREGHTGIRVHAIVNNLEECSVEYIQNDNSRDDLLYSFRKNYAEIMRDIESAGHQLHFVEQYDPDDTESDAAVSQPYAYVVDKMIELAGQDNVGAQAAGASPKGDIPRAKSALLSVNVEEVIANGPGLAPQAWEAVADLRDKIAPGEKIGWWVVYNGDPERAYDSDEDEDDDEERSTPTPGSTLASKNAAQDEKQPMSPARSQTGPPVPPKSPTTPGSTAQKVMPLRGKPEATLPNPKDEQIIEPEKAKDVAKTTGFRKKFFGKKV